jgi:transposase
MANRLKMAEVQTILTLHQQGLSNRKIGEITGFHRETVGRYVKLENSKPAKAPPGSDEESIEDVPREPVVSNGARSQCEPHREFLERGLDRGLSAKRIHQDLSEQLGGQAPSYYSVRRFVARLQAKQQVPYRRMEVEPGEEAQIDFGTGAPVIGEDGRRRRPWVLRVVLSHSRKGYSEVVYRQTTDAFIQCIENAFHHFGGAAKRLVIDNLKAAVAKADWYDPEIHPKLQSFAKHYGAVFMPTRAYTPRHKGKVERGVDYVQENALKGRTFSSLEEQNRYLLDWERSVADTRIHGTTRKQVAGLFESVERPALLALPANRFPFFHESTRKVHRDGYVEVDKAYYSVRPEYVGRRVWVRWDARTVRLFDDRWRQIALHAKAEPGVFRTCREHIPLEKVSCVERGADRLLREVARIGPHAKQWSEALVQARGVESIRVLVGLKSLAAKHEYARLEQACKAALSHGAYRLRTIRELLKRDNMDHQEQFEFLEEHPIIRPLADYSLESLHKFRRNQIHESDLDRFTEEAEAQRAVGILGGKNPRGQERAARL